MDALDEKHQFEGTTIPLAVQWADPLLQIKKRRAAEDSNAENRMVRSSPVSCTAITSIITTTRYHQHDTMTPT